MIEHHWLREAGVLVVRPGQPLQPSDGESLARAVSSILAEGGEIRGILIEAPSFPDWEDFGALAPTLKFLRDHHRVIRRIAAITDAGFLSIVPALMAHFLSAEIRRFPTGDRDAALRWLTSEAAPGLRLLRRPTSRVLHIEVVVRASRRDYDLLLPELERVMSDGAVSFLVDLSRYQGTDLRAFWDEFRRGIRHPEDVRRVALVGDQTWLARGASMLRHDVIETRIFPVSGLAEASEWAAASGVPQP